MLARRWLLLGAAATMFLTACSSGRTDSADVGAAADTASTASADCEGVELEATDIGVTEDTITLEIIADTGSQAIPGLADGSVEALQGWVDMVNDEGGLACRQVELRTYDSKIDPAESRNGMVDACENAFSLVGDYMLSVADVTPLTDCADANGDVTGLPEVAAAALSPVHQCNPTTFVTSTGGQPCPPVQGVRDIEVSTTLGQYLADQLGDGAHGLYIHATTSPLTLAGTVPQFSLYQEQLGLAADGEVGARGTDPQSHYTPFAQTIRDDQSQFVVSAPSFPGFILMRAEAAAQGDDSIEHWVCLTCYDPAFVEAAGDLAAGTEVWITNLPYEEADLNEEMALFTSTVETHNIFSTPSWIAARMFQQAVEDVVADAGPNGLTRASLLDALNGLEDFDANGMIGPVTPSDRVPAQCGMMVRVQEDGTFAREFPEEPGTLSCGDLATISIDPSTAFTG